MRTRIEPLEAELGVDCVIIAFNGAMVVGRRGEGRPRIAYRPLAADVSDDMIDFCRSEGFLLNYYLGDDLYGEDAARYERFRDLYTKRTGAEFRLVHDIGQFRGTAPTKLIVMADPGDRERLYERFRVELDGRAFVTRSEPEYLEIMGPHVDKGAALREIAQHYGVAPEETLAVGDSHNDVELLQVAGTSVAMANAPERVREIAQHVTTRSNNDAGVAEALKRWILA
jgi:Cof subfamily protein (haloacid dehalogenase superfamily)